MHIWMNKISSQSTPLPANGNLSPRNVFWSQGCLCKADTLCGSERWYKSAQLQPQWNVCHSGSEMKTFSDFGGRPNLILFVYRVIKCREKSQTKELSLFFIWIFVPIFYVPYTNMNNNFNIWLKSLKYTTDSWLAKSLEKKEKRKKTRLQSRALN